MKVKNLWVGIGSVQPLSKLVIVKERPRFVQFLKLFLRADNDEYRCVFTNFSYYFDRRKLVPLVFFLKNEQLKANLSKKEIQNFYQENEEEMTKMLLKKSNNPIGFSG